jgi:hypothetical protein
VGAVRQDVAWTCSPAPLFCTVLRGSISTRFSPSATPSRNAAATPLMQQYHCRCRASIGTTCDTVNTPAPWVRAMGFGERVSRLDDGALPLQRGRCVAVLDPAGADAAPGNINRSNAERRVPMQAPSPLVGVAAVVTAPGAGVARAAAVAVAVVAASTAMATMP